MPNKKTELILEVDPKELLKHIDAITSGLQQVKKDLASGKERVSITTPSRNVVISHGHLVSTKHGKVTLVKRKK